MSSVHNLAAIWQNQKIKLKLAIGFLQGTHSITLQFSTFPCHFPSVQNYLRIDLHLIFQFHPDIKYNQSSDYITTTSDKSRLAKRSRSSKMQKNIKAEGTDIDSESDTDSENMSLYSDEEEITDYDCDENVGTDCDENEEKVDDHNYTCKRRRTSSRSEDALSDKDEEIPLLVTQVATVTLEKLPLDAFNKMSK